MKIFGKIFCILYHSFKYSTDDITTTYISGNVRKNIIFHKLRTCKDCNLKQREEYIFDLYHEEFDLMWMKQK